MSNIDTALAIRTYKTLLKAVEEYGWECGRDDEKLKINYGVNGDILHMDFTITIDAERQLVRLYSKLPYRFPKNRLMHGAAATAAVNYALADGSFDYDITDGTLHFRMTTSYRQSDVTTEALKYLFDYSTWAIDKYNFKILSVAADVLSLEELADFCENN